MKAEPDRVAGGGEGDGDRRGCRLRRERGRETSARKDHKNQSSLLLRSGLRGSRHQYCTYDRNEK
jgi:hypothetical protein